MPMKAISAQLLCLLPLALWSCSSEVSVPEGSTDVSSPSDAAGSPASSGPLNFLAPEGWTERSPTGPMRHKEFLLGNDPENELLVVVAHWPSGVGGLQANLDRWKGQVGGGENASEPILDTTTGNGLISTLLDGEGTFTGMQGDSRASSRLLAAYIESPGGRIEGVYTIKLEGSSEAVAPWADSFRSFVRNL